MSPDSLFVRAMTAHLAQTTIRSRRQRLGGIHLLAWIILAGILATVVLRGNP